MHLKITSKSGMEKQKHVLLIENMILIPRIVTRASSAGFLFYASDLRLSFQFSH